MKAKNPVALGQQGDIAGKSGCLTSLMNLVLHMLMNTHIVMMVMMVMMIMMMKMIN